MDLIYTNSKRVDQGVLSTYAFDLSYGATENDFVITVPKSDISLEPWALLYVEGTEYGGIVDGVESQSTAETITYKGRTWHGILNSKVIQPDRGKDYYTVSGDAHEILSGLVARLGLSNLYSTPSTPSGINITYQFPRYVKGYDGIRVMLAKNGAKLKIEWRDRSVVLSVAPIVDYATSMVDGDIAALSVDRHYTKVNHLICLGRGELADREVIHLYADSHGRIWEDNTVDSVYGEVVEIYENTAVESYEELYSGGVDRMTELRNNDKAEIDLQETVGQTYDIGDIVGASDVQSGISVSAAVTQKIVRINNGVISTEYKTGG